jgi:hypothetical protein
VRTAAVAALVVVVVAGSAFSLQAAGLRSAPPASMIAARASRWLLGYRYVTSSIEVHGRTLDGRCYHGWFAGGRGRERRGTVLLLSNGGFVRATGSKHLVALRSFTAAPMNALEVAGCTHVLGPRLASLAQFDPHIRLAHAWLGGRRVDALHFYHLILLVAPKSSRPVGVLLHGIKSRIQLERMSPSLAARLEAT